MNVLFESDTQVQLSKLLNLKTLLSNYFLYLCDKINLRAPIQTLLNYVEMYLLKLLA